MGRFYFKWDKKKVWIDNLLRMQLDSCIYNMKINKQGDWDIMILVSGNRMVRTGKSTLAKLVAAYFSYRLSVPYGIDNIHFDSKLMLDFAIKENVRYGINHYDEARRGLASNKSMGDVQKDLLDYYAECGQLNQINIIVLPDFFKLNEEIAVARSEFLLNVYREETNKMKDLYKEGKLPIVEWGRGSFSFFNRSSKAYLYDRFLTTRKKDYFATRSVFNGYFEDFDIVSKEKYNEKKMNELLAYQSKKKRY